MGRVLPLVGERPVINVRGMEWPWERGEPGVQGWCGVGYCLDKKGNTKYSRDDGYQKKRGECDLKKETLR